MSKRDIEIRTEDGVARAALFLPEGKTPSTGVVFYMDAFGPRAALDGMAERLAAAGHVVLLPDLLYRFGAYGPFPAPNALKEDSPERAEIFRMVRGTSLAETDRDTAAFIKILRDAGVSGKIGAVGYCMGGARALRAAALYADDIVAAASFHGGNLASDADDSPHLVADRIAARLYVGTAGIDRSFPPEQSARLAQTLREAGVDHILENYADCRHGWTIPDHGVYDATGAERHWDRLVNLFEDTLG